MDITADSMSWGPGGSVAQLPSSPASRKKLEDLRKTFRYKCYMDLLLLEPEMMLFDWRDFGLVVSEGF